MGTGKGQDCDRPAEPPGEQRHALPCHPRERGNPAQYAFYWQRSRWQGAELACAEIGDYSPESLKFVSMATSQS